MNEVVLTESLTADQLKVLEELFEGASVAEAALSISKKPGTILKWLKPDAEGKESAFALCHRQMQRQRLAARMHGTRLLAKLDKAIDTLDQLMDCDVPRVRLEAARTIHEMHKDFAQQAVLEDEVKSIREQMDSVIAGATPKPVVKQVFPELENRNGRSDVDEHDLESGRVGDVVAGGLEERIRSSVESELTEGSGESVEGGRHPSYPGFDDDSTAFDVRP